MRKVQGRGCGGPGSERKRSLRCRYRLQDPGDQPHCRPAVGGWASPPAAEQDVYDYKHIYAHTQTPTHKNILHH